MRDYPAGALACGLLFRALHRLVLTLFLSLSVPHHFTTFNSFPLHSACPIPSRFSAIVQLTYSFSHTVGGQYANLDRATLSPGVVTPRYFQHDNNGKPVKAFKALQPKTTLTVQLQYPFTTLTMNESSNMQPQDLRVGNKFRIGRKIGSGSFGDIYLGKLFYNAHLASCTATDASKRHQHNFRRRNCHQA